MKRIVFLLMCVFGSFFTNIYAQNPVISAINPQSASTGQTVIIAGSNFTGVTNVFFGGVPATSFTVINSSAITAIVGNGASGNVSVQNSSGLGSISGFIYIAPPPTISSFSPTSGAIGTTVTITGSNFSSTASSNIVYFGSVKATVSAASASSLTVSVPSGATYQPISVTTGNLTAYSTKPFIVTFVGGGSAFTTTSFKTKLDYSTGSYPNNPCLSDLDGDGKLDVITSNGADYTLSIFRNTSISKSISFATRSDIGVNQPSFVITGDFDGDGKLDIAKANYNGNSLGIQRNNSSVGSINLSSETVYPAGTSPTFVAMGDLDGDGKPDLVLANSQSASISIFKNTSTVGNISFATKVDYTTGSGSWTVAIGDLDGDGKPDLVVSNLNVNSVSVFRNTSTGVGDISFATKVDYKTGSGPRCVAIGDIDGDGKLDLSVANSNSSTVSILRNQSSVGSISFAAKNDFSTSSGTVPTIIYITDLDGDGKLDLSVADQSANVVSALRNTSTSGNISFDNTMNYSTGTNPYGITVGDIDGDGKPDMVSSNTSSNSISILGNQIGDPTITAFTPTSGGVGTTVIISGTNLTNTTAVSFGGVAATSFTVISSTAIIATVGSGASGNISITTNSGTAFMAGFIYTVPIPTISSFTPTSGAIGSSVTITGTNFSTTASDNIVYFGAVKATVTAATATSLTVTVPAGESFKNITVTTNGLTASSKTSFNITFSTGGVALTSSTFSSNINITNGTQAGIITIGDLDGDGKPELIGNNGSNFSVFRNTSTAGNVSYASGTNFGVATATSGISLGDFDGDGKLDVVSVGFVSGSTSTYATVYRNTSTSGSLTLGSRQDLNFGDGYSVDVSDLDGDGKPDIIATNFSSSTIAIFRNTSTVGSISFASVVNVSLGTYGSQPISLSVGDLDNDGKPEIVVVSQNNNILNVLKNNSTIGSLSFSLFGSYSTGSSPRYVVMGDFNGDGYNDIAVGNSGGSSVSIFKNTSTVGSLSLATMFTCGVGTTPVTIAIGDLDGDGKPDIGAACVGSSQVSILRNTSSGSSLSFATSVNYNASSSYAIVIGDVDMDGKMDIITTTTNNTFTVLRNQINEPVITSFTPTIQSTGNSVIISGANFTGTTAVSFGGIAASSFTVISSTAIIATVGSGGSGNVSVTTPYGTGMLAGFVFSAPVPTISSFSPTSGAIGTTVTITGTNFSTTAANNIVYFGAVKATVSAATATSLTVTVPTGASYLPISVTTSGLTSFSNNSFDVTFSGGGVAFTSSMFSTNQDYPVGSSPQSILLGDFDGDGKSDYVYVNTVSSGLVTVYRNTGSGKTIAFTNSGGINTGQYPCCVYIIDIDGDGKLDLVVSNLSSNTVTVLRNTSTTGNISFATGVSYSTGSGPEYFSVGDIDGDGRPDLVIGAANSNIMSVFLNTGTIGSISFASALTYSVGSGPTSVSISDLNNDGKLDIVVANYYSPSVSVFINRSTVGSLSFDSRVDFATTSGAYNIDIHDVDGDGKPDLIVPNNSNSGNTVSVFRNNNSSSGATFNSASFATKIDYAVASDPAGLCVADVDGDGKPDIAVANRVSNTISLLRNKCTSGNISFDSKVDFSTASNPRSVVIGDIDNDGKPDILSANPNSNSVSVLRNQLNEPVITSFTPTSAASGSSVLITGANFTGATAVSFGDVAAASFTVISSTTIVATLGNGASGNVTVTTSIGTASLSGFTYTVPIPTISSFTPTSGVVGTTVIITGTNFNTTASNNIVYFGAVKATVSAATATTLTVTVPNGATFDPITVNVSNLIASSPKPFIVTFSGGGNTFVAGTFASKIDSSIGYEPGAINISDFDGDGKADIVTSNESSNTLSILRNTSSGAKNIAFAPKVEINTSVFPLGASVADFDGDTKPDVAIVSHTNNTVGIFRNTSTLGSITFANELDYSTGKSPFYVASGDLDGDGKIDLVVCNSSSHTVSVYLNTSTIGSISFASKADFSVGGYTVGVTIGDIDGDGKLDILATNNSPSTVSVLRNTSAGVGLISFNSYIDFTSGNAPYSTSIGDFDGDGKVDIVVANSSSTVSVLRNTSSVGNISFATKIDYSTGSGSIPSYIRITDLDGDGKLDIATALGSNGSSTSTISVLRNLSTNGNINFDATVNYTTGNGPFTLSIGDMDKDGKPDLVSGNSFSKTVSNTVSVLRNLIGEPVINSFTPTFQSTGLSVVISGYNFTGTTSVSFGGVAAASFTVISSTAIVATLGSGASGNVTVTTASGSASLAGFTYYSSAPIITSFTPTVAGTGATVIIKGSNFSGATAVSFGGTSATSFTIVNDSTITAIVGSGSSGNVSVTNTLGKGNLAGFVYCTLVNPSISINTSNTTICAGTNVTFTASISNGGTAPIYQWKLNGVNVGTNSNNYNTTLLNNNDIVSCTLTSNASCASTTIANSNNITLTVNSLPGMSSGNALNFDGINDWVNCTNNTIFQITSGTVESWIKTSNAGTSYRALVTKQYAYGLYLKDNILIAYDYNTLTDKTTNINLADGKWHHIALTFNSGVTNGTLVYVDGILKLTTTVTVANQNYPLSIGSGSNTAVQIFNGNIDEVRVWNTIRTQAQINSSMITELGGSETGLIAYYNFNQGNAGSNNSSVTTLLDKTNNSINGTLTNFSLSGSTSNWVQSGTNFAINSITTTGNTICVGGTTQLTDITPNGVWSSSNTAVAIISSTGLVVGIAPGTAILSYTLTSGSGCTNAVTTSVTVSASSAYTSNMSVCSSALPYYWNGNNYYNAGTYVIHLTNSNGCDSAVTLNLSVKNVTAVTQNVTLTGCDSVVYSGITFKSSTIKRDTIRSTLGCDSVYKVATITVIPTPTISAISSNSPVNIGDTIKLFVTVSSGNIYSWSGPLAYTSIVQNPFIANATVSMSGNYAVTITNNGCTSKVASTVVSVSTVNTISGIIKSPKGYYIQGINVVDSGSSVATTTSNSTGYYSLKLNSGTNYKVKPLPTPRSTTVLRAKDKNEVSTIDVALVQSHILQKSTLLSPYKIIAADVNGDGKISALDIVYMKRLILSIDTSFPGNKVWSFVDSSFVFADQTSPFPHKDSMTYKPLTTNQTNQNYIGFVIGDVNWSATSPKTMSNKSIELSYHSIASSNNEVISIPISVKNFTNLLEMQYTLNINNQAFDLIGLKNNVLGVEYADHHNGKISFLWNDAKNEAQTLTDGSIIFELVLKPRTSTSCYECIDISSEMTTIEALDGDYQIHNIILQKGNIVSELPVTKEKWELRPNPTDGKIWINMVVNTSKVIHFQLTDIAGKIVYNQKQEAVKGENQFNLNLQAQYKLASGVYYLKANGIEADKVKRVIIK